MLVELLDRVLGKPATSDVLERLEEMLDSLSQKTAQRSEDLWRAN